MTLFIQLQPLKCAVPLDKNTLILLSNIRQMQNFILFANTLAYYAKFTAVKNVIDYTRKFAAVEVI